MKRITLLFISFAVSLIFSATADAATVYFVEVKGVVTEPTRKYIQKAIDKAAKDNAAALVIKLNTPGGVLESTRGIVEDIFESPVPVVVYVSPQGAHAGSACTFITLAGEYAVMAEGTNIGAAHPVDITGKNIEGDMREKAMNDTVSFMRAIAEKRGRNIEEAVLTVTESKSFTASEAIKAGLIDGVVNNDDSLLLMLETELNLDASPLRADIKPTLTERAAFMLSNPNTLLILFFFCLLLIFLEIKIPGSFVFAGTGIVAIILFMVGINIIPVNMLGLLLIVAGILLFVAEFFLTSYGLFAVAGIASFIGGVRLLFDTAGAQGIRVSVGLIVVLVAVLLFLFFFVGRLLIKDFRRKPAVGLDAIVGTVCTVIQWENEKGKVYLNGEIWNAQSDTPFNKDDEVTVAEVNGMLLTVKAVNTAM
ncbi:MAG: ATP-dependent Clp protease proteolytic subunit [Deferribacteraceae bacterium]|jgi:membrane-bound serine protease (ClpP class)|nr:ATP-dependent Clp protease proteolytic subunit [Deferribacteraceae bacterium]